MTETRRRSAPATRAAILKAARTRFGAQGFDRVRLRDVAADVGVDPAMVIRYFGTKEGLFAAAAEFELDLPELTGVSADDLAHVLMPRFFGVWEDDAGFLSLLRAATTSEAAAAKMLELFTGQVAPAVAAVVVDRAPERAALLGSQILGLAMSRYVLKVPPLADMGRAELEAWVAPVIRHYLTGSAAPE
ncbi:TetR family transcriptional regulator [Amycolatopsis sp. NBRC 101858]|uniref:TetR/AcrR family transcriptional regulator n=1 Tax=Amycolatopsis sp. NBRC 101858 TaxID=3032200 RepID=UPI0024A5D374|nr:TetR family transcriptional regulator [Amycolatopsis sp. NBRC 101858]GLY43225.1 TetR family transcriptional regulator [Amycolatopsis sp. NBRC 101858]